MQLNDSTAVTGDTGTTSPDWTTLITTLLSAGLQTWDRQSLMNYNMSLIAAGKPPLTDAQMTALTSGLTPGVNVGLSSSTQQVLEYTLLGAGAFALLFVFMRRAK
jgi:hypothetical protein